MEFNVTDAQVQAMDQATLLVASGCDSMQRMTCTACAAAHRLYPAGELSGNLMPFAVAPVTVIPARRHRVAA